jgi:SAM-dependent methyltransferase
MIAALDPRPRGRALREPIMNRTRTALSVLTVSLLAVGPAHFVAAQTPGQKPYEPQVGQAGKDVVWVPTPQILVEKMLDLAEVTPKDFVVDLGSGDGRNIIAAAKRGARAVGFEYNPDMVELSRWTAAKEGVSDKATFVQGDMFEADFSQASVLALFLLPVNMERLRPKFLDLRPGTRIVANTFGMEGWEPDVTEKVEDSSCTSWCTALLWIVPAKVAGIWQLPDGQLALSQDYQVVSGTITTGSSPTSITNGKLRGDAISFTAGNAEYTGRVTGDSIEGTVRMGGNQRSWRATRGSR